MTTHHSQNSRVIRKLTHVGSQKNVGSEGAFLYALAAVLGEATGCSLHKFFHLKERHVEKLHYSL